MVQEDQIMLETSEDMLVVIDDELEIIQKALITKKDKNYEPIDNTLDASTLHYIKCRYSWGIGWKNR